MGTPPHAPSSMSGCGPRASPDVGQGQAQRTPPGRGRDAHRGRGSKDGHFSTPVMTTPRMNARWARKKITRARPSPSAAARIAGCWEYSALNVASPTAIGWISTFPEDRPGAGRSRSRRRRSGRDRPSDPDILALSPDADASSYSSHQMRERRACGCVRSQSRSPILSPAPKGQASVLVAGQMINRVLCR